jgi:hypothetical protein
MRIAGIFADKWMFFGAIVILLSCLSPSHVHGQNAGDNAVYSGTTCCTPSVAFIDASVFSSSGDVCAQINTALTKLPTSGGVVDARGISTPQTCAASPWNGISNPPPADVLLPAGNIYTETTWVLPNATRIFGERQNTYIYACSTSAPTNCAKNFSPSDSNNALIEMGSSGFCPTGCHGVAIQDLYLIVPDAYTALPLNGIVNQYSQELSYVDHAGFSNLNAAGLLVGGVSGSNGDLAADSGPYTNLNYNPCPNSADTCIAGTTKCVVINAQTRGLHGITCIGAHPLSSSAGNAAIYVNASSNSIEDVHVEGFWDAIEIGNVAAPAVVGNVLVSNVTGGFNGGGAGPVTNVAHICGPNSPNLGFGACSITTGTVTDVTIFQTNDTSNGFETTSIQDDVTGASIASPANHVPSVVGMYALGEPIAGTPGYSRFSTFPSNAITGTSQFDSTIVPTWGVGNSAPPTACSNPGAGPNLTGSIFSNTTGTASGTKTIWVCVGGTWQPVI